MLLEQEKMNSSEEIYQQLFDYANKNLHKILHFRSISTLMVVAFEIKFSLKSKEIYYNIAKRGF